MKFLTSGGSGYSELSYGFLGELRVGGGRGGAYEALDNLIGQFRDGHLNVTGLEGEGDCRSCNKEKEEAPGNYKETVGAAIEGKLLVNNTSTSFISDDYSGTSEQGTIGFILCKEVVPISEGPLSEVPL